MEDLSEKGQHPVVLVAQYVLFNSLFGQFRDGWIRSVPLVQFVDDHIFETRYCSYVPIGDRRRSSMSLSEAVRLFHLAYQ